LEMGTDSSPTVAGGDESALVRLSCLDGWPDSVLDSALHSTPPSEGAAVQQQGPTSSTLRYQADLEQHQIAGASALVRGRGNVQSAVAFNFLNSRSNFFRWMPFKALSRFSLYVGLLLGFVLVFCPPLGMPPAISSNLIPSILFVRNAAPTFPNSCRSSHASTWSRLHCFTGRLSAVLLSSLVPIHGSQVKIYAGKAVTQVTFAWRYAPGSELRRAASLPSLPSRSAPGTEVAWPQALLRGCSGVSETAHAGLQKGGWTQAHAAMIGHARVVRARSPESPTCRLAHAARHAAAVRQRDSSLSAHGPIGACHLFPTAPPA